MVSGGALMEKWKPNGEKKKKIIWLCVENPKENSSLQSLQKVEVAFGFLLLLSIPGNGRED